MDLSNLQRQVLHDTGNVGVPKVESAAQRLRALNPDITVIPHKTRLTADNALELIDGYDIIADGSDNFETRFLVNDACHLAGKTLVSGAILRFDGQVSTFATHRGGRATAAFTAIFRRPDPLPPAPRRAYWALFQESSDHSRQRKF